MKAQASLEYMMILAFLIMVIIPIIGYSLQGQSSLVYITQADDAVTTIANAVDSVYALGPGNKIFVLINTPPNVESTSIENNEVLFVINVKGDLSDIHMTTKTSMEGSIPTEQGIHKIFVETLDSGVVSVGEYIMSQQCGNNAKEGTENCDGSDLSPYSTDCSTYPGFASGTLSCLSDCSNYDTTSCQNPVCGNDLTETGEICDGIDLNGETCITRGYASGTLSCLSDCSNYDTTNCVSSVCGNDLTETGEICDGIDLNGETCVSQGYFSGTLSCVLDCNTFNTTQCQSLVTTILSDSCYTTQNGGSCTISFSSFLNTICTLNSVNLNTYVQGDMSAKDEEVDVSVDGDWITGNNECCDNNGDCNDGCALWNACPGNPYDITAYSIDDSLSVLCDASNKVNSIEAGCTGKMECNATISINEIC